jgi:hypothetical protein
MSKFSSGIFLPKNPRKYVGTRPPTFRSSWEMAFMRLLDEHPFVINWASESIRIPYQNPLTGRWASYIPDFVVLWLDKNGKQRAEIIEIKPAKESLLERTKSKRDKIAYVVNQAKWGAAIVFAKKHGMVFRVLNETQLFRGKK